MVSLFIVEEISVLRIVIYREKNICFIHMKNYIVVYIPLSVSIDVQRRKFRDVFLDLIFSGQIHVFTLIFINYIST